MRLTSSKEQVQLGAQVPEAKLVKDTNFTDLLKDDRFGTSIAIDGNYLAVGAPGDDYYVNNAVADNNSGAVYVFDFDNSRSTRKWRKEAAIVRTSSLTAYLARWRFWLKCCPRWKKLNSWSP